MARYWVEAHVTRRVWGYVEADSESDAKSRAECDDWDGVESEELGEVSVERVKKESDS